AGVGDVPGQPAGGGRAERARTAVPGRPGPPPGPGPADPRQPGTPDRLIAVRTVTVATGAVLVRPALPTPFHHHGTGGRPPGQSDFFGRFGCSIVPVHDFAPQRQAQIFFRRFVCGTSRTMP